MSEESRITFGRLTHLLLGNFKAFKRTQRIPIRPITLIYGKNNSGKSSIIQALLYAEHVRRTGELNPEAVVKDGKPVLDGGWSRLVHGRGKKQFIEFGWEWSNPGSVAGFRTGKIWHEVSDLNGLIFKAELNGASIMESSDPCPDWCYPLPNREHPSFLSAVSVLQKWFAQEFRELLVSGVSEVLSEALADTIPRLEAGDYAEAILDRLLGESPGLQYDRLGLPPRFTYFSPIAHDLRGWGTARYSLHFSRSFARGAEGVANYINGEADRGERVLADWGLTGDLLSHVDGFIAEKGSYLLYRWFNSVLEHFEGPIRSLVENAHYLSAVRSRPEHIVFREPENLAGDGMPRGKKRQTLGKQHRDWIWQEEAVRKANRWLKRHQQLTANIELRSDKMKSRKRPGVASQTVSPAGTTATLYLYDRDRKVELNFNEVGYGLSQFIPVLLACYAQQDHDLDEPAGTLLIEEPEAHVHPALQAEIGELFAQAVTRKDHPLAHIICETHSEHLLLRLMKLIRQKKLSADKVSVIYVENLGKESFIREMPLNEKGESIRDWPGGFFEEGLREVLD